ncbi:hypothetical protein ACELLULO517_07650 [Acidisoma cellulosilytica]|uniref:Uncharacterized protein n=1 Tax=Acidisoma cellulosilyticum TaxID=2802395 RepID=A0A963YZU6_9PROT|nr:hypothetical protein [Acidisoma cellulosilyticum]MCB8880105.1 hypothetical protein [Acidisoma cellulosilyticum]
MGWANCGTDSKGRPIGYGFPATCDHPDCKTKIDRGLSYACGDMHGDLDLACEGYFCTAHLKHTLPVDGDDKQVCEACYKAAKKYATENPEDAHDLVAWFEDQEGEDWRVQT